MENKAIVYVSGTGNTKLLAEEIEKALGGCAYIGKPDDKALESDIIYVGFWTFKFDCPAEIQGFLAKLAGKKVFLFGTAGYDNTQEYFDGILDTVAAHLAPGNEVIGRYMCQARVSDGKKKALEAMDAEKYRSMLPKLAVGDNCPTADDLARLHEAVAG